MDIVIINIVTNIIISDPQSLVDLVEVDQNDGIKSTGQYQILIVLTEIHRCDFLVDTDLADLLVHFHVINDDIAFYSCCEQIPIFTVKT